MNVIGRLFVLTGGFLILANAYGQEPGQTPRPPVTDPVREPTEEELARLDKEFPEFFAVKDDAPFPLAGNVIVDAKKQGQAIQEERAYDYVLAFAKKQPAERMAKYSLKDVPIENLYRPIRSDYLRELIHVEGRLSLVQTLKPTPGLESLEKVDQLYEAWIIPQGSTKLVCLVVSELPEGVTPGENQNKRVAFDAYYFKLWHYETRGAKDAKDPEKKQWERAPLFLGKTFVLRGAATDDTTYTPGMLMGVVGGLVILVLAGAGMAFWFRKGDQATRSAARHKIESGVTFEDNPEPAGGPVNRIADQFRNE
ncbi:MAG TPA: hypothetical protein VHR66_21465 [Gemmataceae bacterium]|jgi:hypothetical protein|nr:hypothetical protein [Gemmataceae bacterium]